MCQSWRKRALPFFLSRVWYTSATLFMVPVFSVFPFFLFFRFSPFFVARRLRTSPALRTNLPQHLTYRRCLPHTRKNKNQNLNQSCLLKSGATAQSKFGVAFPDPEPHCSEPHCSQTVLWLGCPLLAFWLSFFLFFFAFV